jgi:coenzyme F420-reducing hydrogenase beta subunit
MAQSDSALTDTAGGRTYLIQNVERNGEVLPEIAIKEVTVVGRPTKEASRKSEYRKYERLIYNLKKVYPYALVVRQRLNEVNVKMAGMNSDKTRREYIKQFEKDVFAEFEDDIRNMTITQGRLLIKLIDRETQNTSYELIKDYRGGLTATFWQGIARIFGTNLKDEYDPFGEDALMEVLLQEIEDGKL